MFVKVSFARIIMLSDSRFEVSMYQLGTGNTRICYEIKRSKRKTMELSVYPDGRVVVKAPERISVQRIEEFVAQKAEWIQEKTALISERQKAYPDRIYEEGTAIPYLGKSYQLHLILHEEEDAWIQLEGNSLEVHTPSAEQAVIQYLLIYWYKENAKKFIKSRVKHYSQLLGETVEAVRIKDQKTRFGSCSSKRNLNFNWRLMMAPKEVLDYVVIHELCHLKYMNHSKEYWSYVESVMPNYREYDNWLKENGSYLKV